RGARAAARETTYYRILGRDHGFGRKPMDRCFWAAVARLGMDRGSLGRNEMLTRDKLTKALKQTAEMAKSALAQGCTTDRGIAAQEAQRAVQEADEYLAAGDMLEAYGLFCFASGKLCDNHAYWRERFRW